MEVKDLKTSEDCEKFARNLDRLGKPDIANNARLKGVKLRVVEKTNCYIKDNGNISAVERDTLIAIYAYEETLRKKYGKAQRAQRTWNAIKNNGIVSAAESAVKKQEDRVGYIALAEIGLEDLSFESVVLKYPDDFSEKAVSAAKSRLYKTMD